MAQRIVWHMKATVTEQPCRAHTQRYFDDPSAFERDFFSNRTLACARMTENRALASAVEAARGQAWQYNGGYWQYRPSPII